MGFNLRPSLQGQRNLTLSLRTFTVLTIWNQHCLTP